MPVIEIPGQGRIQFPDTMSGEEINAAAKRLYEQAQPPPVTEQLRGAAGTFLSGATAGFLDELGGEVRASPATQIAARGGLQPLAAPLQPDPLDAQARAREQLAGFEARNPGTALALNIGGGLAGGLTGGRLAAEAFPRLARTLPAMPAGQRALAAGSIGAAGGGVGGGLAGAGEAPTMADVPLYAGRGAALGAALGGPLGALGDLGAAAFQRGGAAIRNRFFAPPQVRAERAMTRGMERTGMGAGDLAGRQQMLGPEAVAADTSTALLHELDSMASQPGRTGALAGRELARRSRRQIDRATDALGEGEALAGLELAQQTRKQVANPLYRQAFAEGIEHTDELDELIQRDAMQRAFNVAKRRYSMIGGGDINRLQQPYQRVTIVDGEEVVDDVMVPTLEGWQEIKEVLDDARSGAKGNKLAGRIKNELLRPLLSELDEQAPRYRVARGIWSDAASFEEAIEEGRKFINEPSAVTIDRLKKLTDSERQGYRIGAIQSLQDKIESPTYTSDVTRIFNTPKMRRKLDALFSRDELVNFLNEIEALRTMQRTFAKVGQGSDTARRAAFAEDEGLAREVLGVAADIAGGQTATGAVASRIPSAIRRLPVGGMPEEARDIYGQMLMSTDPLDLIRGDLRTLYPPPLPPTRGAGLLPPLATSAPAGVAGGLLINR